MGWVTRGLVGSGYVGWVMVTCDRTGWVTCDRTGEERLLKSLVTLCVTQGYVTLFPYIGCQKQGLHKVT